MKAIRQEMGWVLLASDLQSKVFRTSLLKLLLMEGVSRGPLTASAHGRRDLPGNFEAIDLAVCFGLLISDAQKQFYARGVA